MNKKLLKLLSKDSRTPPEDLAVMLGVSEDEVRREISNLAQTARGMNRGCFAAGASAWGLQPPEL